MASMEHPIFSLSNRPDTRVLHYEYNGLTIRIIPSMLKTRRSSSRAAARLRLAASNVGKTDSALAAFHRRLAGRIGKAKAITATARKIAVLFYNTLRYGRAYVDPGASYYEERYRQRTLAHLRRRARSLGYVLQELPVGAEGVS
jgi:hypothetical protein